MVANQPWRSFLIWLTGSCLLILVLSMLFAQAPQQLKRLGLFFICYGLLNGLALRWIATESGLPVKIWTVLLTGMLVAAGGLLLSWTTFQQFKAVRAAEIQKDPEQLAILKMLENIAESQADVAIYRRRRRELQPQFVDYLAFRVSSLGPWNSPWPVVFWIGELTAAALIASILIRQETEQSPLGNSSEMLAPAQEATS